MTFVFQMPLEQGLKSGEEAVKFAEAEISKISALWTSTKWDELDWGRIKELQIRDILEDRTRKASEAQLGHCFDCPHFVKHVSREEVQHFRYQVANRPVRNAP